MSVSNKSDNILLEIKHINNTYFIPNSGTHNINNYFVFFSSLKMEKF